MMFAAVVSGAPSASASSSVAVPPSIDATGTADVTASLTAFIAGVADGTTITFPSNARYRLEGSLVIDDRKSLTFEGNGAEFFATTEADRDRRHWWIRNSDGITIRELTIRGANPNAGLDDAAYRADREAQHGFDFAGATNVLLERVTVTDVYGDFVYIGLGKSGWSKNVTVRDSTFERNGRQGIAITAGEDIRIEGNRISAVRRSTFDIEPNTAQWGARRVTIADNDIGPGRLNFVAGHGSAGTVDEISIVGNRLKGKPMNVSLKAPSAKRRSNFSLIGNVSDASFGSSIAAVTIEGFDGVTIRDNVLPLAAGRGMTAVAFRTTCNTNVTGNQFVNAARDVSTDGYDCAKKSSPATTGPTVTAPASGAAVPTTKPKSPSVTAATGDGATDDDAVGGESQDRSPAPHRTGATDPDDDGSSVALPAADDRIIDPPSIDSRSTRDSAIWVLAIGAVVSLAVLIPVSRRRR